MKKKLLYIPAILIFAIACYLTFKYVNPVLLEINPEYYAFNYDSINDNVDFYTTLSFKKIENVVPKKTYTKLGIEYTCKIELLDSMPIINSYKKYKNFTYEIIRFNAYQIVERYKIIDINIDTIYTPHLKIYDIKKFNLDKYLKTYKNYYQF